MTRRSNGHGRFSTTMSTRRPLTAPACDVTTLRSCARTHGRRTRDAPALQDSCRVAKRRRSKDPTSNLPVVSYLRASTSRRRLRSSRRVSTTNPMESASICIGRLDQSISPSRRRTPTRFAWRSSVVSRIRPTCSWRWACATARTEAGAVVTRRRVRGNTDHAISTPTCFRARRRPRNRRCRSAMTPSNNMSLSSCRHASSRAAESFASAMENSASRRRSPGDT